VRLPCTSFAATFRPPSRQGRLCSPRAVSTTNSTFQPHAAVFSLEAFAMMNLWDIPPPPTKGDDDQEITYAGVGRVLSQWEMIEVRLGYIYVWLMKRPDEIETVRAYGEGKRNFEGRISGLRQIAEVYFLWNPHQDTEGELDALISMVR
jgi:hypothetical protein